MSQDSFNFDNRVKEFLDLCDEIDALEKKEVSS